MQTDKSKVLTGDKNKRLNNSDAMHNEGTAAWADSEKLVGEAKVSVPSENNVLNAKEWVDNGSKL